jgi:nucleoside-diphosphate-sugar epimerase
MTTDWTTERVLVTGGTGMVGANLLRRLVALGNRPFVFMRDPARMQRLEDIRACFECVPGDIADAAAVERAVETVKPRAVFHLASSYFNPPTLSAADHMNINAMGLLYLCEALTRAAQAPQGGKIRLVAAGSCAIYTGGSGLCEDAPVRPGSVFGVSKAAAGTIARFYASRHGIETVELRLFTPFGPWESARRLIPDTILSALDGRDVRIGHGAQQRDFVYVDDVVDALLRAATARLAEPWLSVNIGGGVGRPIRDVATRILELMGDPVGLTTGTRPVRADEIWEISADISTASQRLGWRPKVAFDDGLRRTIDWFRDHRALAQSLT